jgi:hypothetical protein
MKSATSLGWSYCTAGQNTTTAFIILFGENQVGYKWLIHK